MKSKFFLISILMIGLSSCASFSGHEHQKDRVFDLNKDGSAIACSSDDKVAIGEKLKIFDYVCKKVQVAIIKTPRYETKCEKLNLGEVEVIKVEGNHHLVIKPINSYKILTDAHIEKL